MSSSTRSSRPHSIVAPADEVDVVWQPLDTAGSTESTRKHLAEERRRTIIISTLLPPDQWDDDTRSQISRQLSSMAGDIATYDPSSCRRTHSCSSEVKIGTDHENAGLQVAIRPMRSLSSSPFLSPKQSNVATQPSSNRSSPMLTANKLTKPHSPLFRGFPRGKIYFYNREDPYYGFTNFSSHSVQFKGKVYPTSEHLFQSFKVSEYTEASDLLIISQFQGHRPLLAEHIRLFSDRPSVAFGEARRFQPEVRPDWKDKNIEMVS